MRDEFYNEYRTVAPKFSITVKPTEHKDTILSHKSFLLLMQTILLMPSGINKMDNAVVGVVSSSDNLGELRLDDDCAVFVCEIRTSHESVRNYICQKFKQLAVLFGATCRGFADYPGGALQFTITHSVSLKRLH